MNLTKDTFLHAEDSKNRDAMLYDMLTGISEKIDDCNKVKAKVRKCQKEIATIKGILAAVSVAFSGAVTWFGIN